MQKNKALVNRAMTAMLLAGFAATVNPVSVFADTRTHTFVQTRQNAITGTVVDETGEPMIGVTIKVKNSQAATITDIDGNFSLNAPKGAVLEFSYVGYTTQTVKASNGMKVQMASDSKVMDEVVVIGYGTQKKRDLTGAIVSVKSEEITKNPGSNPMEALQGKVAGLDITRASGQPGEGVTMQLRGTRSFSADGNPTFIIDGMPGDYSTLNPNDIASIEILKDASSTAVYGASGANGVVIITTKSGKEGKLNVNFNAFAGFNGWSKTPKMRSGESYLQGLREANKATGNWTSEADDRKVFPSEDAYRSHLNGEYIDWVDELMQNGYTQNYSLSVSGGTEKTKGYLSMNFSDENGQYKNDNYKVYSTNMRIDHKVKNWLKIGANLQGSYVHRNKAFAKLETAMAGEPLGKLRDENGKLIVNPCHGSTFTNLLLNSEGGTYKNQDQNFKVYFNPYIEVNPMKGLSLISRMGVSLEYMRNNYFQGEGSYQYYYQSGSSSVGTNDNVYATITNKRNLNYKWENILTYNFNIRDKHDITLTGVVSWEDNQYDYSYMKQTNIESNKFLWHNMDAGSQFSTNSSEYTMSKALGFVGRVNYSYMGKYLFSASVRHDGSSRLMDGNRWDTFPAFSLGWRISDEKFMESAQGWLDNLKLRVGYGVTGTASISPYTSISSLDFKGMALGGSLINAYTFSKNYTNPDLTWEKSYNTNIGVDASFLRGRINFTGDFYITKTDGVIWSRNLPITNGGFSATEYYYMNQNICETKNTGMEMTLNTRNIVKKDFQWSSTVTFTYNKEKIVSLIDGTSDNIQNGSTGYTLSKNHPVNSFYHYKLDGVWQLGEEADAAVFGAKPGDLKINVPGMERESEGRYFKIGEDGERVYYDKDNRYTVSNKDYQVLGHNSPDWTLGFQNQITYKNFDLSIFMYMRWGQMINYSMLGRYDPSGVRNFPEYFNYWTVDNPSNDFPAIYAGRNLTNYVGSAALSYVDGSFFKIKNITLGYTLPKNLVKKAGIEKCRFYGTITNPLVVAKSHLIKDYDPEMNGALEYPLTRQLVFGVNLSF
ncbi:TonB-dependent receptor [Prevotella sp. PINT]|jgi:TonB-linked outer membrane protein, SusC/RagA family/TonB-dependent outer membrane receptor, SusC/RagA subfamily, signature region|uniref:SusC/RagA family TonB-linked outer membrane protein n=1 Tax=Palleniella intestinalis TaxID=2736291 RepID=UPI001552F3D1|nr:TonB-dependent receptor [Palleniella intestinalis]